MFCESDFQYWNLFLQNITEPYIYACALLLSCDQQSTENQTTFLLHLHLLCSAAALLFYLPQRQTQYLFMTPHKVVVK